MFHYMSRTETLLLFLFVFIYLPQGTLQCAQQYKKELRYLDFYLGIRPIDDEAKIPSEGMLILKQQLVKVNFTESRLSHYIQSSKELNCDFKKPCAWDNVESDSILDTSEFYTFEKKDGKRFPVQVRPGSANPKQGRWIRE